MARPSATPDAAPRPARWLAHPGWLILPLRAFLAVTFTVAGLQKLANPEYLDARSPTSVAAQMRLLQHSSPIGALLGVSTHVPAAVGLLIAVGELAVGIGTLLGLYKRIAAVGGALLSLTFFLTVSWNTTPYYYGSDIVFLFCWVTVFAFGDNGVLSLDAWLRNRARATLGLGPEPTTIAVSAPRLRALCARGGGCGLRADGTCSRLRGCPVFPVDERLVAADRAEINRRTMIRTGAGAALTGIGVAVLAGAAAAIGRAVGGTKRSQAQVPAPRQPAATPSAGSSTAAASPGTSIGNVAAIPVGQAKSFTDPATGAPAWVVHPSGTSFVAFSAVCTHAGCPVQYDSSSVTFVCPCHGGVYDARTGKVLQGPPPAPLQPIFVHVVGGQLRVGR